jgi:hypothetical protein
MLFTAFTMMCRRGYLKQVYKLVFIAVEGWVKVKRYRTTDQELAHFKAVWE